jgi:BirA family biotin operon repressor/biotin-[acetyl-CoA-carboxylase] ligase
MIIGKKIIHYQTIDSTNDAARRLIKEGAGEGLVVVAVSQTAGRGKPGADWVSPSGNLYLSAVVKPHRSQKDLAPLTLTAALAARSAILKISKMPVVIKWPNDILIRGKKAGGILTERVPSGHLIIGIGINLNSKTGLPDSATTLGREAGKKIQPQKMAEVLIQELDKEYLAYLSGF